MSHVQKCYHCKEPCPEMFCQECQDGYEVRKALKVEGQRKHWREVKNVVLDPAWQLNAKGDYMTSEDVRKAAEAFIAQHGSEVREALRPRTQYCVRLSKGHRFWDHLVDALDEAEARTIAIAQRQMTEDNNKFGHLNTLTVVFTCEWGRK